MSHYKSNLRDIEFNLFELLGRDDVLGTGPFSEIDGATAREILIKAMRQLIIDHEVAGFRMFDDDVDAAELAAASPGFTGADLKELLRRAQLAKAMQEARTGVASTPITQFGDPAGGRFLPS